MLVCMFIRKRGIKIKRQQGDKMRNEAISSVFQNDFMDHLIKIKRYNCHLRRVKWLVTKLRKKMSIVAKGRICKYSFSVAVRWEWIT